jgi:hypothetical protein
MDLKARIEELEAEVADLKRALGVDYKRDALRKLGLTEQQAGIVGVILKRDVASYSQILIGAHPHDLDKRYMLTARSLKVPICNALRKLSKIGVEVENIHSRGYRMPPESKSRLLSFLNQA